MVCSRLGLVYALAAVAGLAGGTGRGRPGIRASQPYNTTLPGPDSGGPLPYDLGLPSLATRGRGNV
jgi:hypothetical protein